LLLDLVFLFISLVTAIFGLYRGLIRELCGIAGLVLGTAAAYAFCDLVGPRLAPMTGLPAPANAGIAFFAIFVVVALITSLAGRALTRMLSASDGLRKMNRGGGLLFGALKGALISLCFAIPLSMLVGYEGFSNGELKVLGEALATSRVLSLVSRFRPALLESLGLDTVIVGMKAAARDREKASDAILNSQAFASLKDDAKVQEILNRPEVRSIVEGGDINAILNDQAKMSKLLELAGDPAIRQILNRFANDRVLMDELRKLGEGE
jgi:membrane protein required for colicin V production